MSNSFFTVSAERGLGSCPQGFLKGMGQGIMGVAVKPTAGLLDFTSTTSEGFRASKRKNQLVTRVRPPRAFGAGSAGAAGSASPGDSKHSITAYSLARAQGRMAPAHCQLR